MTSLRIAIADVRFFLRDLRAWFLDTFEPVERYLLLGCVIALGLIPVCIGMGVQA